MDIKATIQEHPWAVGLTVFGVGLLVLYWLGFFGGSSNSAGTSSALTAYYSAEAASTASGNQLAAATNLNASKVAIAQIEGTTATDIATLQAKTSFAKTAIGSIIATDPNAAYTSTGYDSVPAGGAGGTGLGGTASGSSGDTSGLYPPNLGATGAAGSNYKPWLTVLGDQLFGNADVSANAPGGYAGPGGVTETGSAAWAKYLGLIGGQGWAPGGASWDQYVATTNYGNAAAVVSAGNVAATQVAGQQNQLLSQGYQRALDTWRQLSQRIGNWNVLRQGPAPALPPMPIAPTLLTPSLAAAPLVH